jgi:hypothetical protein
MCHPAIIIGITVAAAAAQIAAQQAAAAAAQQQAQNQARLERQKQASIQVAANSKHSRLRIQQSMLAADRKNLAAARGADPSRDPVVGALAFGEALDTQALQQNAANEIWSSRVRARNAIYEGRQAKAAANAASIVTGVSALVSIGGTLSAPVSPGSTQTVAGKWYTSAQNFFDPMGPALPPGFP